MISAEYEKKERLIVKLERELGKSILSALKNDDVIEIMLNPDGIVWFDSLSCGMYESGDTLDPIRAFNIITTVAAIRKKVVNDKHPSLECALPIDGSRFSGLIPEVVENPVFNIRKRALQIFTLEDYVTQGIVTTQQADVLRQAIKNKLSIIIAGGPGTGKTTFANALLSEMVRLHSPVQRFIIVEDKPELQCAAKNKLVMKNTEFFSYTQLLRYSLVARPDIICVGEARGGEILILLKAWNTGTKGGISTLHANDACSALSRIEAMIEENAGIKAQPSLIVEAVDIICALSFHPKTGRRLNQVLRLKGHNPPDYIFENLSEQESNDANTL
jgi:P-type conjugative transfer ATPase TrbB